jgi:N-acetylmuramic acid 6-phosphate etherase
MQTEQPNPKTHAIDQMPTLEMLRTINDEDQRVALAVQQVLPAIAQAVDLIAARLADAGRLFYVGAGTSGRLGVLDAVECVPTFGVSPEMVQGVLAGGAGALMQSVEGAEDEHEAAQNDLQARHLSANDVVVGIAASGRTPYVLGALAYAKRIGAPTVGIACNLPAPLLDAADIAIGVDVGPEVITGSTRLKAGSAQKLVLNMLSTASMVKLGKVYGNLMVDVQVTNAKLRQRALNLILRLTNDEIDTRQAAVLLQQADDSVKVAVVMQRRGVDAAQARALLVAADGRLRAVIG